MKYPGFCLVAALVCQSTNADMQLTMTDKHKDGAEQASQTEISIRDGKVLFREAGDNGEIAAIYDSSDGSLTQVDHGQKMYVVMDKESMKETASQMSTMMKQVEAQLANLPKEQREMMMKSMPGLAGGMGQKKEAAAIEIEWTGEKKEVAGYPCKIARIKESGKADGTACIAKPKDLDMSDEDFDALASMFETMKEFADTMTGESAMPDMREIGGFPISTTDPDAGVKSTLTSASDATLDSEMFEVPASYTRRSITGP